MPVAARVGQNGRVVTPSPSPDRATLERDLIAALLELVLHELGNPLQSLTMLVELSLSGLREWGPSEGVERATQRLERAFDSTDRLQRLVHAGGKVSRMFERGSKRTLAEQLDPLLELLGGGTGGGWLPRRRVALLRETDAIDHLPVPSELAQALAWLLLGAGEAVRIARLPAATFLMIGRLEPGGESCELAIVLERSDGQRVQLAVETVRNAARALSPLGELVERPDGELLLRCRLQARRADPS